MRMLDYSGAAVRFQSDGAGFFLSRSFWVPACAQGLVTAGLYRCLSRVAEQ